MPSRRRTVVVVVVVVCMLCRVLIVASGGVDSGHGGAIDVAPSLPPPSSLRLVAWAQWCLRRRRLQWRGHGGAIGVLLSSALLHASCRHRRHCRCTRRIVVIVVVTSARWQDWVRGQHEVAQGVGGPDGEGGVSQDRPGKQAGQTC